MPPRNSIEPAWWHGDGHVSPNFPRSVFSVFSAAPPASIPALSRGRWAPVAETKTLLTTSPPETEKAAVTTDASVSVPEDVVRAAMKAMQESYNGDDMAAAASIYAPECLVTVNGGVDAGGSFTGKTREECATFLGNLRNTMGGTNIQFTVTNVDGAIHQDTWIADNGTGSCKATWALVGDKWLIAAKEILFTPKGEPGAGVPTAADAAAPTADATAPAPGGTAPAEDAAAPAADAAGPTTDAAASATDAAAPTADAAAIEVAPDAAPTADVRPAADSTVAAEEAQLQTAKEGEQAPTSNPPAEPANGDAKVEEIAVKQGPCC